MKQDLVDHIQRQWLSERPDLDTSPIGVIGRISRLGNYLRHEIVAVYREYGLGEGEFDILATLRRNGAPFTMLPTELSRQTMVTSGAISKQLDRLEAANLVVREASATDGRSRTVRLTPDGLELINRAFEQHMANEARLLEGLSATDRATLESILSGWLKSVENDQADFSA